MSGDLLRRLFELTRAPLGDREPRSPVDDESWHGASEQDSGAEGAQAERADDRRDGVLAGYYANLEIPYGSDLSAVRSAWKQMMKRYHPDLHGEDPEKRQVASELTAELTRAYQELAKVLEQDGNR